MIKELKNILENHHKLINMISDKNLPIKSVLLQDITDMKIILETAKEKRKNGKPSTNNQTPNQSGI